ncbi:MAG: hypothetical protein S4CHLAM2_06920 [Chlamydiales bacterium]|nr:hypothetical protein [Chlamydiales bacterium]
MRKLIALVVTSLLASATPLVSEEAPYYFEYEYDCCPPYGCNPYMYNEDPYAPYCQSCDPYGSYGYAQPCAPCNQQSCDPRAPICGTSCGLSACSIALAVAAVVGVAAIIVSSPGSSTVHSHNP